MSADEYTNCSDEEKMSAFPDSKLPSKEVEATVSDHIQAADKLLQSFFFQIFIFCGTVITLRISFKLSFLDGFFLTGLIVVVTQLIKDLVHLVAYTITYIPPADRYSTVFIRVLILGGLLLAPIVLHIMTYLGL